MDSLFEDDQLALFKLSDDPAPPPRPTIAEDCAMRLACEFRRRYTNEGSPNRISEELETLSLACLLLIADYNVRPDPRLLLELTMCRDCLQTFHLYRFYDALPFDICLQLLGCSSLGLATLRRGMTTGDSSVRGWVFDIGWFVRRHLNPSATENTGLVGRLLKNVEDTLGGWDASLALCRSLCPTREAFWSSIEFYEAETIPEQYEERMAWAKDNMDRVESHPGFMLREVEVRRVIDAFLLGPTMSNLVEDADTNGN